jgi:DNA-binding LytR/AlgR family response regulator
LISCRSFEEASTKLSPVTMLVLLDIKMASKDGIEVFQLLKDKRADLAIVFHSAYPGSSEKGAALKRPSLNGYLTRGEYDRPELLTTTKRAKSQTE